MVVLHPVSELSLEPEKDIDFPVVLTPTMVGLTPMMAMIKTLAIQQPHQLISFIRGTCTTAVQAFRKEVQCLVTDHANIASTYFIKSPITETDVELVDDRFDPHTKLDKVEEGGHLRINDKRAK